MDELVCVVFVKNEYTQLPPQSQRLCPGIPAFDRKLKKNGILSKACRGRSSGAERPGYKFFEKPLVDSQNIPIFGNENTWCGSSVWLECRPVTPEVASSSLVRTA